MASRRRRRRAFTWFPTLGTQIDADDNLSGRELILTVGPGAVTALIITPLTFDVPGEGENLPVDTPLNDFIGNEYIIERIVGKFFAAIAPNSAVGAAAGLIVGAGFFVARADDTNGPTGPDQPIGSAALIERRENYSPLAPDTIREPWIWRRTWMLGNFAQAEIGGTVNDAINAYPPTTGQYGSVADGPHIDAKSVRKVGNDERLYFAVAAKQMPSETGGSSLLYAYLDYRILGQLRRARNRSNF